MITFVVGGARSGKSTFAEEKAKKYGGKVTYIATSIICDEGMAERVRKHKAQRPSEWATIEKYNNFDSLSDNDEFINADVILLDCITTMIGNMMFDSKLDFDKCSQEDINILENKIKVNVTELLDICNKFNKKLIIVSNEVGLGLVPSYYMGNYFRDISGRINSLISNRADNVYFTVSGIPLKLKDKGETVKWPGDF